MLKQKRSVLLVLALLMCLVLPRARAEAPQSSTIDPATKVIVKSKSNKPIRDKKFKKLGSTDYYTVDISQAKKDSGKYNLEIEPNNRYKLALTSNDTLEPQTYMTLLSANSVWDVTTGSSSAVIADIDSGFALSHEDLTNKWATNPGEMGGGKETNGVDDDGNGFIDDWRGWDFAHNDNDPSAGTDNPVGDAVSHGTETSGLIAAETDNNKGVASLNRQAKILPLQIFDDDGYATTTEVAQAMDYAINTYGVDLINMSLGSTGTDSAIEALLATATTNKIVVVAAAGNCGDAYYYLNGCSYQGQTLFPATDSRTIAVAATDLSDARASFSSQGTALDVAAPGSGAIKSTLYNQANNTSYTSTLYGTSFSTPITTSAASLIKTVWPTATNNDIRDMLVDTAVKVSGMGSSQFSTNYGWGRIAPLAAINRANLCKNATHTADINCDGNVDILDLSILASTWNLDNTGRSDMNNSGKTDILDLSTLASQWGT